MSKKLKQSEKARRRSAAEKLPFRYRRSASSDNHGRQALLRVIGTPGYILLAIGWLCLIGGMCFWLLQHIPADESSGGNNTAVQTGPVPPIGMQHEGVLSSAHVLGVSIRPVAVVLLFVLFGIGAVYSIRLLVHGAGKYTNRVVELFGSPHTSLFKGGLLVMGWAFSAGLTQLLWSDAMHAAAVVAVA